MARRLRHTPEGGALFEVTCRTVQSRLLLRSDPLLNEIILGALARAKRRYGVELSAFIFLSNDLQILAWASDREQLARFMSHFLSKLARVKPGMSVISAVIVEVGSWAESNPGPGQGEVLISNLHLEGGYSA